MIFAVFAVQGAVDNDMLRHLATEVGDEWRRLAQCLGIRAVRQQAIMRTSNASGAAAVANARRHAVYDMLTSWMKRMPHSANKVCSQLVDALVIQWFFSCCCQRLN